MTVLVIVRVTVIDLVDDRVLVIAGVGVPVVMGV